MKNTMSLENYGVVEMTTREMKTKNGGIWKYVIGFAASIASEIATNPKAHFDAFMDGFNYEPQPDC